MELISNDEFLVTTKVLSSLFGVTDRTISNWVEEGMPKEGHGKFNLKNVMAWQRKNSPSFVSFSENREEYEEDEDGDLTLKTQKALAEIRMKKAKAESLEIELKKEKKKLLDKDIFINEISKIITAQKSAFLSLPTKLSPILAEISDPNEVKETINSYVRDILEDLSSLNEHNIDEYIDRVANAI